MTKKRKILHSATIKPIANGWVVEIAGSIEHYYSTEKSWLEYDKADNERYFKTLKEALRFLQTFQEDN